MHKLIFNRISITLFFRTGNDFSSFTLPQNLEDLILETKIHPVTALTTLSMQQKRQLLERKVVVCRDIHNNSDVLRQIGVPEKRINTVLREVEEIRELRR